ncbi:hypothetical protein [Gottfriedia solisilvae]
MKRKMKSNITRSQADKLYNEVLEHSIKYGFPVLENKKLAKQKQKKAIAK